MNKKGLTCLKCNCGHKFYIHKPEKVKVCPFCKTDTFYDYDELNTLIYFIATKESNAPSL